MEKISEYVADATSNPITNNDLMDFSNWDGAAYDVSKKILVSELMTFVNANVENYYKADGVLTDNRAIYMAGFRSIWEGGDIGLKADATPVQFYLTNSSSQERGLFRFDDSLDSGQVKLYNASGEFFSISDSELILNTNVIYADSDFLGVHTSAPSSLSEDFRVRGVTRFGSDSASVDVYENRMEIKSGGSTNSYAFRVSNDNDGEYFSVTSDGGDGRVGINTPNPNASAALEITSTSQGFLCPRMTTVEKNAISTPPTGLIVYDLTLNKICVYTGAGWETVTSV